MRAQAGGGRPQRGEPAAGADGKVSIRIAGPDDAPGADAGDAGGQQPTDEEAPAARGDEAGGSGGRGDSSYQGYDVQRLARWMEHALPFSLLLLGVFIRQHLQGFFVMIWIAAVMFKSNDILRKQTALKATRLGERRCRCHAGLRFRSMPTTAVPHRGYKPCCDFIFLPVCSGGNFGSRVFRIKRWWRAMSHSPDGASSYSSPCQGDRWL